MTTQYQTVADNRGQIYEITPQGLRLKREPDILPRMVKLALIGFVFATILIRVFT